MNFLLPNYAFMYWHFGVLAMDQKLLEICSYGVHSFFNNYSLIFPPVKSYSDPKASVILSTKVLAGAPPRVAVIGPLIQFD